MFRSIIEAAITAFIVVGTLAVIYVGYTALHAAIYDPSLPHGEMWRALFGSGR